MVDGSQAAHGAPPCSGGQPSARRVPTGDAWGAGAGWTQPSDTPLTGCYCLSFGRVKSKGNWKKKKKPTTTKNGKNRKEAKDKRTDVKSRTRQQVGQPPDGGPCPGAKPCARGPLAGPAVAELGL